MTLRGSSRKANAGAKGKIQAKKNSTTAIISMLLGLCFWVPLLNFLFGVLAILFGFWALKAIKKNPNLFGGRGYAIAGIIMGFIPIFLAFAGLLLCLMGNTSICQNMGLATLAD